MSDGQIATENPPIRPAVISLPTQNRLNEYRGFRHIVRNVYTYKFDPVKIGNLVQGAPGLFEQIKSELIAFTQFLEQSS